MCVSQTAVSTENTQPNFISGLEELQFFEFIELVQQMLKLSATSKQNRPYIQMVVVVFHES